MDLDTFIQTANCDQKNKKIYNMNKLLRTENINYKHFEQKVKSLIFKCSLIKKLKTYKPAYNRLKNKN